MKIKKWDSQRQRILEFYLWSKAIAKAFKYQRIEEAMKLMRGTQTTMEAWGQFTRILSLMSPCRASRVKRAIQWKRQKERLEAGGRQWEKSGLQELKLLKIKIMKLIVNICAMSNLKGKPRVANLRIDTLRIGSASKTTSSSDKRNLKIVKMRSRSIL